MPADKEWAQLNADQFAAAKLLGYSKASWYEPAPPQRVEWTQLSEEELSAAKLLGWDEDLWANELEAAGGAESEEDVKARKKQEKQARLAKKKAEEEAKEKARAKAAEKAGFQRGESENEFRERMGETPQVVEGVFDKEWKDLSAAEAKAAKQIGYTAKSWYLSAPPRAVPFSALSQADAHVRAPIPPRPPCRRC